MPDKPLALVTGGAKRVGAAIVRQLAADGYTAAVTFLSSAGEAELLAKDVGGIAIRADLTQPPAAVEAIRTALSGRRLAVLVNSASIYEPDPPTGVTSELIQKLMAIHLESPLLLTQAFADELRQSNGHVVNMLDILAERPWPRYTAYCASKAALWNLTLSLARQLAPQVTVNGIAPGVVEWPKGYAESEKEKYLQRVPLARAGTPADVAAAVHYFVTAGSYVTGQIIRLDGGRSLA
jgi:pteridine reductase